jgi:hypothetical protein
MEPGQFGVRIMSRLRAGNFRKNFSIPGKARRFYSSQKHPDSLLAQAASYSAGSGVIFAGAKRLDHEAGY